MDHRVLLLFLSLWSSGLWPGDTQGSRVPGDVRLVGGASSCAGQLERRDQGEWKAVHKPRPRFNKPIRLLRPDNIVMEQSEIGVNPIVHDPSVIPVEEYEEYVWNFTDAAEVCRRLNCGSVVSLQTTQDVPGYAIFLYDRFLESNPKLSPSRVEITCSDSVRLVDGTGLCSGRLEVKQSDQSWSSVCEDDFDQQDAEVVCRQLGCGAPSVLQGALYGEVEAPVWTKEFQCGGHESALLDCRSSDRNTCSSGKAVGLTCSELGGVRLVGGANRCDGKLEMKQEGEWKPGGQDILAFLNTVDQKEGNLRIAGRVCAELDCGSAVSARGRQDIAREVWAVKSECTASSLVECFTHLQHSYHFLEITCSGPQARHRYRSRVSGDVRLVGGASSCAGQLERRDQGEWKAVHKPESWLIKPIRSFERDITVMKESETEDYFIFPKSSMIPEGEYDWHFRDAAEVCRRLNCGSVVSLQTTEGFSGDDVSAYYHFSESNPKLSPSRVEITCSDSVRLVDGTGLCSGRLEVKQSDQSWSSVCEDDFDQQDAEVVCRQLGCGAPSVLQGALYGEVEAPVWTKEFQCGGHESALLDCRSSDRNTCSSGKAAGLTCSELGGVRLVGGANRCDGKLEMKRQGEWKPVGQKVSFFSSTVDQKEGNLRIADRVCAELDCGSAVSARGRQDIAREIWAVKSECTASSLVECFKQLQHSYKFLEITCSDSQTARLVDGTGPCSGRLEVKPFQSNQSWSSVCEDDFDQQDAEVVCRQLGCGAPSVLQGALYGEVEAPVWTKEFQCGGHESALLDCRSSDRNTCSSGKAVGLTCSDPDYIRLEGEPSRCAGELQMKVHGEWRPVVAHWDSEWDQKSESVVCRELGCGSSVSTFQSIKQLNLARAAWWINSSCVQSESSLKDCVTTRDSASNMILDIICSDLLVQPNISASPSTDTVYQANQLWVLMGSNFTLSCSIEPQYPGGFFQLVSTTSNTIDNSTLPAVNHSAHFLFSAADHTHRGEYRCVYHLKVFFRNFSSESQPLYLIPAAPVTELIIRIVVHVLVMSALITALCCTSKATRNLKNPEI